MGRKKIYLLGTVVLIAMGLAAGFAPNIGALIGAKLAQGVGSAMTQGTSMAMLIASFPSEERGKALGLQMSVVGTGNVAGPAVGGFLVGALGWEWVFFATSIMATAGLVSAFLFIDSGAGGQGVGFGSEIRLARRGSFDRHADNLPANPHLGVGGGIRQPGDNTLVSRCSRACWRASSSGNSERRPR